MSRVNFSLGLMLLGLILSNAATSETSNISPKAGVAFKVLHHFTGTQSDGGVPYGRLLMDKRGNLYGMASTGGAYGFGTVYRLINHHGTYTLNVTHSFNGDDGSVADNDLILKHGVLYGETGGGGTHNRGTLFSVRTDGTGFKKLYDFSGGNDGAFPVGGVVMDNLGNLYGMTNGDGIYNYGGIFEYANGTLTTLVSLDKEYSGAYPAYGLTMDKKGNLWGTTQEGGPGGGGVVLELVSNGVGGWKLTVVNDFSRDTGSYPEGPVVFSDNGSAFGTTMDGGTGGAGVVYSLEKNKGYNENVAYNFDGGSGGAFPFGQVVFNSTHHLFGAAASGGNFMCRYPNGCGIVFELTNTDGSWQENVVHTFERSDGCEPEAGVILDRKGNAFGTAPNCGLHKLGTVFEISGVE